MISAQNTRFDYLGSDLRPHQPEPMTARTAMEAANLLDAVMAERRQRLFSTLAIVACFTSQCDLTVTQEPETAP